MKPTITTHDHAPASFHRIDALALSRAADCDDTDHPVQSWRMAQYEQLESDKKKIEQQLIDAEKQADLDRANARIKQTNTEYQLKKAQAERLACLIALVVIVVLAFVRGCSL